MYLYDELDRTLVAERVAEFRDQVGRRLSGELTEDEFKPLRLMNGIYLQLHAYMARISIPYGTLSSDQLRMLAHVGRRYDRGYGHFTTRQNIQFHWIKLEDLPDVMADLSRVGLHGMQTSGNCVRNVTTDQWAGVAPEEVEDPRIWAEVLRQHCTLHPEFTFLPRKFKIALTASSHDRAAVKIYDIGLRLHRNGAGETGFEVTVGGGLGRTPFIGKTIKPFLPKRDIVSYVEAILRVYNLAGRRDNIYKARIKILVHDLGAEAFARQVEAEWLPIKDGPLALDPAVVADVAARFSYPDYEKLDDDPPEAARLRKDDRRFAAWLGNSVDDHKVAGHAIVTLSLKAEGATPGDATSDQMDAIADLADRYSFGEIRVCHEQNLVLPHVAQRDLPALWRALDAAGLATPNVGLVSDIISCGPARGSIIAASPIRARSRSRRRSPTGSAISISRATSAGCTSTFPAASMPAATITSVTSAFSVSRRTARSSSRSPSAAVPTRRPSSVPSSGRQSLMARSPTPSRTSSRLMSSCASGPTSPSSRR